MPGDESHFAGVDLEGDIRKGLVVALVSFAHQIETDHRVTRWPVKPRGYGMRRALRAPFVGARLLWERACARCPYFPPKIRPSRRKNPSFFTGAEGAGAAAGRAAAGR